MKPKTFTLHSALFLIQFFTHPLTGQSLVTEDTATTEVNIAADLYIEGNDDPTTAALEIDGDALVKGDQHVQGELILNGQAFAPGDYLKTGYTSPRSGFLGNDIYSADTDNALFLADRRFAVTESGFTNPQINNLFDGNFDSGNSRNRILPGESATINFDLLAKGEFNSRGIVYPEGNIYVTFYYKSVGSGLSGRYWDRDGVERPFTNAEDVHGNGRLWRISVPSRPYMTRFELTIDGPLPDSDLEYTTVMEIEYHMFRHSSYIKRPHLSKYIDEKLYKNLSFQDADNQTTIQLRPGNGKIIAEQLELSGSLTTSGTGSIILGNSGSTTPGAIRYNTDQADFQGYDGTEWKSLTVGSGGDSLFSGATVRGKNVSASGDRSTAWGIYNTTEGYNSTAWGESNTASGYNSTAWGYFSTASEWLSTAWGRSNTASGYYSTAWGQRNTASGSESTAWGLYNNVSGSHSTAWGSYNNVGGSHSTAWGTTNTTSGDFSTSWGGVNTPSGFVATTWGAYNKAESLFSTAFGRYNIGGYTFIDDSNDYNDGDRTWFDADPLLEIGAGVDDTNRANALTLLKDGRIALGKHDTLDDLQTREETLQIQGALLLSDYAEAPETPTPGAIRYNTDQADFQGYKGNDHGWVSLTEAPDGNVNVLGEFTIDNTPDDTTDLPLAASQPGALTVQGGSARQGSDSSRSGAIFRMGDMTIGATKANNSASSFQWFTELDFTDYDQQVVYIYLGEFPFQMWGYFDVTVATDYWSPSVGRGAITKRFPIAYNTYNQKYPGSLHGINHESSAVIAAAGGIIDYVTIGEAELHGEQFRVPVYFKAGSHTSGGISVSGIFTRAYNEDGYPYAEIESHTESIVLDNAIQVHELKVDGPITFEDGTTLSSAGGIQTTTHKLTTPDQSRDAIIVDTDGRVLLAEAHGDIPMFGQ